MQSFKLLPRKLNSPYPSFHDYESQPIGAGSFGKVYRSIHKHSKKIFAIKAISKFDAIKGQPKDVFMLEQVNHELQIMYQLDCEFIIKVHDHFQDQKNIYIILEYADGVELYKGVIQKRRRLQNQQIARVIYQLCFALKHLHEKNIIHRDIKPENIILTRTKDIKLIDFGTSNYVGPEQIRMTRTGSIPYFAPEIVTRTEHGEAVDVWCVGILLYEMYVLKTPFEEVDKTQINIVTNKVLYPADIDPQMKDLISKILVKDPKKRLRINDIIKHPWIVKHVISGTSISVFRSKSRSLEKQSSSKRMSPKSLSHRSLEKSKQKSKSVKSLLKKAKTQNQILKDKILKLNQQIDKAIIFQKKQEEKQKAFLQKKVADLEGKLIKYSKQAAKYESIIKINTKKINQINQQINAFETVRHQNEFIQQSILQKKRQEAAELQNRKSLRLQLANLETQLKMNKGSRKSSNKHSTSQSRSRSKSSRKPILSSRSVNKKYLSTKSQKMTTEGSMRETNLAEIEGYINNLMIKHNLATS